MGAPHPAVDELPPPPEEPDDDRDAAARPSGRADVRSLQTELLKVLADLHGQRGAAVRGVLTELSTASRLWSRLEKAKAHQPWLRLIDLIEFELASPAEDVPLDLEVLADRARASGERVAGELLSAVLTELDDRRDDPQRRLKALLARLRSDEEQAAVAAYLQAVADGMPLEEQMRRYEQLLGPPMFRDGEDDGVDSATSVFARLQQEGGDAAGGRISFGLPTLDVAMTNRAVGETRGTITRGEFFLLVGASGSGKTGSARFIAGAARRDLDNQGMPHAPVMFFMTEEEPKDALTAMGILQFDGTRYTPGPAFSLGDAIDVVNVSTSRDRVVESLFKRVAWAEEQAVQTGEPISDFLPAFVILDYVGNIKEPGEQADTEAIANTVDLLMYGVARLDREMIERYSNVRYEEFIGRPWPEIPSSAQVAVVAYAQFKKVDEGAFYRPDSAGPEGDPENFVLRDEQGRDLWELRPGDFRRPRRSEIAGKATQVNHATAVLFPHRSRPFQNAREAVRDDGTVRRYLGDTRARIIVEKARKSMSMAAIPLSFDSDPQSGFRGIWMDPAAEKAFEAGKLNLANADTWRPGDPMLPVRTPRARCASTRY